MTSGQRMKPMKQLGVGLLIGTLFALALVVTYPLHRWYVNHFVDPCPCQVEVDE